VQSKRRLATPIDAKVWQKCRGADLEFASNLFLKVSLKYDQPNETVWHKIVT